MIGEVWLCSGQSNMEMPIKGFQGQPVNGSLDIIAQATPENNIRIITIQRNSSCIPLQDCDARWEESTPQSVANVSATAYFFACYLQNILNVPVGIEEQFPEVLLEVLNKDLKDISKPHVEPTLLYNAMINPIQSYTIIRERPTETNRNCISASFLRWYNCGEMCGNKVIFHSIMFRSRLMTMGEKMQIRKRLSK